ncbi:MAG: hypothetical protein AAF830_01110 [Pseudomonadota bacterium]
MGDLGDAFSFENYVSALERYAALQPSAFRLAEMVILGGLGIGALVLFVMMFLRRSGTAAAGFALLALTALSLAIVFGNFDFLTSGTIVLIGTLAASSLVLFVNAVLHTGRENLLVAGISAIVIGVVITLGVLTAAGIDYASEARIGMIGASIFAALVLAFAMARSPSGQSFLGITVLVSIFAAALMLDQVSPMLSSFTMTIAPLGMIASALLLSALAAPFVADEVRMDRYDDEADYVRTTEPGPLFQSYETMGQAEAEPMPPEELFQAVDAGPPLDVPEPDPIPEPPLEPPHDGGPASSLWTAATAAAPLEVHQDEYVWDALAQPEVRCGSDVLSGFGAYRPEELTPEGLRERLDPSVLASFDDQVLGGGDPVSGPFDVVLMTSAGAVRFAGRRQVDHDGILMRIDGQVAAAEAQHIPAAAMAPVPEPIARAPQQRSFEPIMRLDNSKMIGFDATPAEPPASDEDVRALIDDAGAQLARMIADDPRSGAFALLDASVLKSRISVVTAAVGKAVRVHGLPRGAFVVGCTAAVRDPRGFAGAAEDIRMAGGGMALILRDLSGRAPKLRPDMVWIDARDANLLSRSRRSVLSAMSKRLGAPIVVRNLDSEREARSAHGEGAIFGTGRGFGVGRDMPQEANPFADSQPMAPEAPPPVQAPPPRAPAPSRAPSRADQTPIRSQGLR